MLSPWRVTWCVAGIAQPHKKAVSPDGEDTAFTPRIEGRERPDQKGGQCPARSRDADYRANG